MKKKKIKRPEVIKSFNPDTREVEMTSEYVDEAKTTLDILKKHYPKKVIELPAGERHYYLIADGQAFLVQLRGK